MKSIPSLACAALAAACSTLAHAEFTLDVDAPHFRVIAPNLPPVKMAEHPSHKQHPNLRLIGVDGPYLLTVNTPDADKGMTAQDCANVIAGALPRRPGAPPQEHIVKRKLDANTFAAMYVVPKNGGQMQMNAHLITAAGGDHCVEFHAAKITDRQEEIAGWLKSFEGARIEVK